MEGSGVDSLSPQLYVFCLCLSSCRAFIFLLCCQCRFMYWTLCATHGCFVASLCFLRGASSIAANILVQLGNAQGLLCSVVAQLLFVTANILFGWCLCLFAWMMSRVYSLGVLPYLVYIRCLVLCCLF